MTPDVFVTVGAAHPYRIGAAIQTLTAWSGEARAGRCRIIVQDVGAASCLWAWCDELGILRDVEQTIRYPTADSQRLRHQWAHEAATTDWYVLADDDCVLDRWLEPTEPHDPPWVEYVARLFATIDNLAMFAPLLRPGPPPVPHPDGTVRPAPAVGGIRFCRRGFLPNPLPPHNPAVGGGYDPTLGRAVREQGNTVGWTHRLRATHLGHGWSTTWSRSRTAIAST